MRVCFMANPQGSCIHTYIHTYRPAPFNPHSSRIYTYIPTYRQTDRQTCQANPHIHIHKYMLHTYRLARLTLTAPASGIPISLVLIFNLLRQHPPCVQLLHRYVCVYVCVHVCACARVSRMPRFMECMCRQQSKQ